MKNTRTIKRIKTIRILGFLLLSGFLFFHFGCNRSTGPPSQTNPHIKADRQDSLRDVFPPAADWSVEKLSQARACAVEIGATAVIIIHDGKLVAEWGDTVKRTKSHSVRKSLLSGIRNNPETVSRLLALPEQVYPVFGFCLGYPAQDPEVKPRLPLDVVLNEERYQSAGDAAGIRAYDEQLRHYYRTRTGGKKESCWTEEMKLLVGKEDRPHMRGFLKARGFVMK